MLISHKNKSQYKKSAKLNPDVVLEFTQHYWICCYQRAECTF